MAQDFARATLLALALPAGAVLPCAAQGDVLVSNLSQGSRSTATVGDSAGSQIVVAVGFKTGSHSKGYTLTSIRAALSNAVPADGVRIRLFSESPFGIPENSLLTFDNPTISNGTKTFTAPANTTLQKDTQYFLVFDSTAADANYGVGATESDSLTSQVAGWELNASRQGAESWRVGLSAGIVGNYPRGHWVRRGVVPIVQWMDEDRDLVWEFALARNEKITFVGLNLKFPISVLATRRTASR